jgi:hypothetical protein
MRFVQLRAGSDKSVSSYRLPFVGWHEMHQLWEEWRVPHDLQANCTTTSWLLHFALHVIVGIVTLLSDFKGSS